MDLALILITIAGLAFVVAILLKLFKLTIKLVMGVLAISVICMAIFGFFVVKDTITMKNELEEFPTSFLLYNQKYLAGFKVVPGSNEPIYYSKEELNSMQDEQIMQNQSGQVIIFEREVFETFINDVEIMGQNFTAFELKQLLDANDPYVILESKLDKEVIDYIKNKIGSTSQMKGVIFSLMFQENINEKDISFFLDGLKEKNIRLGKKSFLFESVDYIPDFIIDSLAGAAIEE